MKELAIALHNGNIYHFLFKSNTLLRNLTKNELHCVRWLENNLHGIKYEDGYLLQESVINILHKFIKKDHLVFVKGQQKMEFLTKRLPYNNIVNLEDNDDHFYDCPVFQKVNNQCPFHNIDKYMCSYENVKVLYNYLKK